MDLTKHGFDSKVSNVKHLEAIFDLIEGKWKIYRMGHKCYFVYDDDIFTPELKAHQAHLSKKFWSYRNYKIKDKIWCGCSVSEFKKEVEIYEKELEEKRKKEEKIQKKQMKKVNADRGIYGIYCNNKLIYIGKTDVDFETRFKQHKYAVESGSTSQYLYKYLGKMKRDEGCVITLKPLVNIKDLKVKGTIRNRDIEAMELALIQLYQSICNIQGIKQDYEFTY